jgi:hypothetical protein
MRGFTMLYYNICYNKKNIILYIFLFIIFFQCNSNAAALREEVDLKNTFSSQLHEQVQDRVGQFCMGPLEPDVFRQAFPSINSCDLKKVCQEIVNQDPIIFEGEGYNKIVRAYHCYFFLAIALIAQKDLVMGIVHGVNPDGLLLDVFEVLHRALLPEEKFHEYRMKHCPSGTRDDALSYIAHQRSSRAFDVVHSLLERAVIPTIIKGIFLYSAEMYSVRMHHQAISSDDLMKFYQLVTNKYFSYMPMWGDVYYLIKRTYQKILMDVAKINKSDFYIISSCLKQNLVFYQEDLIKHEKHFFPKTFLDCIKSHNIAPAAKPSKDLLSSDIDDLMTSLGLSDDLHTTKKNVKKIKNKKKSESIIQSSSIQDSYDRKSQKKLVAVGSKDPAVMISYSLENDGSGQWSIKGAHERSRIFFEHTYYAQRVKDWFERPAYALENQGYTQQIMPDGECNNRYAHSSIHHLVIGAHTFARVIDRVVDRLAVEFGWRAGEVSHVIPYTRFFENGCCEQGAITYGYDIEAKVCYHRSTTPKVLPLLEKLIRRIENFSSIKIHASGGYSCEPACDGSFIAFESPAYMVVHAPENPYVRMYNGSFPAQPYDMILYKVRGDIN